MATVNQMIGRLQSLNIKDESFKAVTETKDQITEIQKDQFLQGFNAQGKKIGRYRNRKYASAKFDSNPLAGLGNVDLKLTGSFYQGFVTEVNIDSFKTSSTDAKNDQLVNKYDPFGLDQDSKSKYAKVVRPVLVSKIKGKLKL